MQKQPPSLGRIAVMGGFTLSCFALLLFLWSAFGGPVPFKPRGYRFTADFTDASLLAVESDVRIAGVSVGKVKGLGLEGNRTRATIELEDDFAPLPADSKAMLRQKTLLGETYVELTPGRREGPKIGEEGHLANARVEPAVEIDEIFQALDADTRQSFRDWLEHQGRAIDGRGQELNEAFGNLGPFAADAADVLEVLDRQGAALEALVRNTGEVFGALTERGDQLATLIENSNDTFSATASEDKALAETFRIFPTFLDESKSTLARLETFSRETRPLVRELTPAARELSPTLVSLRGLAPELKELFTDLDPLVTASRAGLPALREFLTELGPLMEQLDPFLANLNPILRYISYQRHTLSDFMGLGHGLSGHNEPTEEGGSNQYYLRVLAPTGAESLALHPRRVSTNRGNGYMKPFVLTEPKAVAHGIWGNWDCVPSGGPRSGRRVDADAPNCYVQDPYPGIFGGTHFPQLRRDPDRPMTPAPDPGTPPGG